MQTLCMVAARYTGQSLTNTSRQTEQNIKISSILYFFPFDQNLSVGKLQAWLHVDHLASAIPGMERVRLIKLMKG